MKKSKLEKLRKRIERIDKKIAISFNERMNIVSKISIEKKKQDLVILDKDREEYLIKKNSSYIKNQKNVKYYQKLFNELLDISKEYQKDGN